MTARWSELLRQGNAGRSAVVGGGMIMHALNTFIVVTILPSVVREIGGLRFFAWNTTLYVVASLLGGACCTRLLARLGARWMYRLALGGFALGCMLCALAPDMPVLLVGRLAQGLGAGTLSALSYTMIRLLFAEHLWPRAIGVISAMWGIATLVGPALGGFFAQYTGWRVAFWTMFAAAPCFALLVERSLPRAVPPVAAPRSPLAAGSLLLLAGSVLAVSAGSMAPDAALNALGVAVATSGLAWFVRRELSAGPRLLPHGACNPSRPLGAAYAGLSLLLIGVNTEIFVPYFLQVLHGMTPLHAGYLTALMAGGWALSSVFSSSAATHLARIMLLCGPFSLAVGLIGMRLLMPTSQFGSASQIGPVSQIGAALPVLVLGLCLLAMGFGIGMCWPQLAARVFTFAPEGEKELAASSITVVVMVANAFGSALGGMVTNLAGLTAPGGAAGASSAATWLFGLYVLAPVLAAFAVRRVRAVPMPAVIANS